MQRALGHQQNSYARQAYYSNATVKCLREHDALMWKFTAHTIILNSDNHFVF